MEVCTHMFGIWRVDNWSPMSSDKTKQNKKLYSQNYTQGTAQPL